LEYGGIVLLDEDKYNISKIIFSKINRKLTLLFIIVAVIAPSFAIYYFYNLSVTLSDNITPQTTLLLQTITASIIILIAVDAGVIGFFVSKSISKPIKKLYTATKKLEEGDYDIKVEIKTGDEIQRLAEAFNRTTAALSRLEQERKELDTAKTDFLSITSHELRSPMTPMKAQLQMMQEGYFGKLTKKQKDSLNIITRNADRLDKIIVDFLEISRIEAARLKFNFKEIDPSEIVKETVKFMDGFAKEKNIKLKVDLDDLPNIEADPDRISQVLRNLINNAIKFSEKKSKIEISARLKEDYIEFCVKDYGCGLTHENQIRIFEPFYQVEGSQRRRHGGTGLGLAICRGIVESQKGKIWVESKIDKGSRFTFTIPLKPVRKIEPIKILFSRKGLIERKIKEEFKTVLGPLGVNEFEELKKQNSLDKNDLIKYIDNLKDNHIITDERGIYFKDHISEIYGDKKGVINEKKDTSENVFQDEVIKRN